MSNSIPIRTKLMLIIMSITTAALTLSGIGLVIVDSNLFRATLQHDLSALGQITAENSTAALAFNDPETGSETLTALKARTHLEVACTYRADGTILAQYSRAGARSRCPAPEAAQAVRFAGGVLTVSQPVVLSGRRIGTSVLVYDLGELAERRRVYGTTVLAVLLASLIVSFLLSSGLRAVIATPISQLVRATTSVLETGDYSIRARKMSRDELGVLVDRFNEMLAGIQSRDADLRKALYDREEALHEAEQARERFHFMAESMPQKIFTAKPNGDVDYFNRQWMEFTGLTFEQIRDWGWVQFIHPDDVAQNLQIWRTALASGEAFHFQHRFRRADGAFRWHLSRVQPMRDPEGRISMWIGSNTDIHEQKEKEEELRRANEDLQQFAYSASHDLQEPIRNVAVFSELVARRYESLLDDDGKQFLGFLSEGGRRLAKLVNDLLAYTRAGAIDGIVDRVDSLSVLTSTLSNLAEAIRENGATVTYDTLPDVYMAETHLQQLFQNLIVNALRYRTGEAPQIHIAAVKQAAAWRFSVQDNGIGIDPQYKEKIFGVFKRLEHDHTNGGTGIGLAICKRVVEIYGGRIWVESQLGKGATFFFTVAQPAERIRSGPVESSVG